MTIAIEKLTSVDEKTVADINVLLAQLRKDGPTEGPLSDIQSIIANPDCDLMVLKDGATIVGMASLYITQRIGKKVARVEDVVVEKKYRGQGLGEKLMREIIERARARGVKTISLTSRPARVAGNKLYQKVGFTIKETNVYRYKL